MARPQITSLPRVAFVPLEEREPQGIVGSIIDGITGIFNPNDDSSSQSTRGDTSTRSQGGDDTSTSESSFTSSSSSTSSTSQTTQSTSSSSSYDPSTSSSFSDTSSSSSSRNTQTSSSRTASSSSSSRETTRESSTSSRTRETSTRPTSTYQPPTTRTTSTASVFTSQFTSAGSVVVQTLTSTVALVETLAPDPNAQQNTSSGNGSGNGGVVGGVVGGVIGGLAALVALVLLAVLLKRRRDRTGHAYFLCLGTRPNRHLDGGDGDWPTFDPNSSSLASATGAGAVGAAFGAGSRRGRPATPGGTLPEGFDDPEALGEASSHGASDMREWHSGAPAAAAAAAYARSRQESHGALSDGWSQPPVSASGPNGFGGPSDDGHHVMPVPAQQQALAGAGNAWGLPMGYSLPQATAPIPAPGSPTQNAGPGPDYGHLDPPEVRQQRAIEAAAVAAAAGPGHHHHSGSDLAHQQSGNSGYGSGGSGGRPTTASSNHHGGDGIFSDAAAADAYANTNNNVPSSPRSYNNNKRQSAGSMMSLGGLAPPTYLGANNGHFVDAHSGTPTREDGEFQFSNPRRLAPTNPDA